MTFDQYLAAFALGRLLSSDLPEAATQALREGYKSVELAALAGSTSRSASPSELEEMWRRGLRDVNKAIPSRTEAGPILRDYYAALVANGELAPRAGAEKIVRLSIDLHAELPSRVYAGDGLHVPKILALLDEYDDLSWSDAKERETIDAAIKEACQRLLSGEET